MTWIISKIVGNPVVLIALLIAAFVAGGSSAWWVQGLRITALQLEYDKFVFDTKAEGESAAMREKLKTEGYEYTLKKVKEKYESQIPIIRANAVDRYIAAHGVSDTNSCSGQVLGDGTGVQLDDGAKQERIFVEREFIQTCAEDAAKVGAFQSYCTLNHCPIKD